MFSASTRAAVHRTAIPVVGGAPTTPAIAPIRTLASQPARRGPPSRSSADAESSTSRTVDLDARLRKRVLRVAAYATHELALTAAGGSASPSGSRPRPVTKDYVAQAGFHPTPSRRVPPANRAPGGSPRQDRSALVEVDPVQVEASMARRRTRHAGAPLHSRFNRDTSGTGGSSRSLSTSARAARASGIRLAEESLVGLEPELDSFGMWDDHADSGAPGKGKAGPTELQPGDLVEVSRNGSPTSGIYLSRATSTARRILLLTAAGARSEHSLDEVTWTIPQVVPRTLATQILATTHAADLDRSWNASEPCVLQALQALRHLEIEIEHETKLLVARGANYLYRILQAGVLSRATAPSLSKPRGGKGGKSKAAVAAAGRTEPPTSITVATALSALGTDPTTASPARQYALHRLIMSQPTHFVADELALRSTGRFDLRPAEEVERFARVRTWTRSGEQAHELVGWAEKCARVRHWARQEQARAAASAPSDADGAESPLVPVPVPKDDPTFRWSPTDLVLFGFLRDTLAGERLLQAQPHMSIAPLLLKAVDTATARLFPPPRTARPMASSAAPISSLDQPAAPLAPPIPAHTGQASSSVVADDTPERSVRKDQVRQFLSQVGVVAPWENWAAHERVTGLARWDETGAKVERALALRRTRASSSSGGSDVASAHVRKQTGPLSTSELYPTDPHDSVRHEFGPNVTVYTIDDIGASELDDGISLMEGPPSPSSSSSAGGSKGKTWWVHVHIADPTALLHPGHLLAKLARVRDHTEYFPEKTWAMLPQQFVVDHKLSLGAHEGKEAQRVLSLGMRIDDETGEVLESEVKAGVVRDVRRLTYGAVDRALGYTPPSSGRVVRSWNMANRNTGGNDSETPGSDARVRPTDDARLESDPQALGDLRTLHRLAGKLLQQRVASSALFWQFPSASVSVAPKPILPHFRTSPSPTVYATAPRVSLQLPSAAAVAGYASHADSPAQLLVSEMMVAGNRAAARFAAERSLPAPFRTQAAPSVSDPADLDAVLALRNPLTGQAPAVEVLKRGIDFLPGSTTPTPGPHWPMGIDGEFGYLKVTSPLRRYSDLFAHYQLKSALLPPASAANTTFAPQFSRAQVQAHLDGFAAAAKSRHRLDSAASAFWALWVLEPYLARLAGTPSRTQPWTTNSAVNVNDKDDEHHETLDLLANGLTALAMRLPTHSAVENVYVQPVLIPQLGLRGTLQVDRAADGAQVGEEVPVRIAQCVLGPRSRVVCARR